MFYKYVLHLFLDESGDMVVIIKGPQDGSEYVTRQDKNHWYYHNHTVGWSNFSQQTRHLCQIDSGAKFQNSLVKIAF